MLLQLQMCHYQNFPPDMMENKRPVKTVATTRMLLSALSHRPLGASCDDMGMSCDHVDVSCDIAGLTSHCLPLVVRVTMTGPDMHHQHILHL